MKPSFKAGGGSHKVEKVWKNPKNDLDLNSIFWHIPNKKGWKVLDEKVQINENLVVKVRFQSINVLNRDRMLKLSLPYRPNWRRLQQHLEADFSDGSKGLGWPDTEGRLGVALDEHSRAQDEEGWVRGCRWVSSHSLLQSPEHADSIHRLEAGKSKGEYVISLKMYPTILSNISEQRSNRCFVSNSIYITAVTLAARTSIFIQWIPQELCRDQRPLNKNCVSLPEAPFGKETFTLKNEQQNVHQSPDSSQNRSN